jgi:pyruvate,orthophosphate dikinase
MRFVLDVGRIVLIELSFHECGAVNLGSFGRQITCRLASRSFKLGVKIIELVVRGTRMPPLESKALEVNLQSTAVDVVIPDAHKVLLEITEPLFGVQQETAKLLTEIHHQFVGWTQTLEDLHYRAMGDVWHYLKAKNGARGIAVYCELYDMAATSATPLPLREVAIRYWLYYLDKLVSEASSQPGGLSENLDAIRGSLAQLGRLFEKSPKQGVLASPRLRQFCKTLVKKLDPDNITPLLALSVELLCTVLLDTYDQWLSLADPLEWFDECTEGAAPPDPLPRSLARIAHANLEEHRGTVKSSLERVCQLDGSPAEQSESLCEIAKTLIGLPDNGQIVRGFIDAATFTKSDERKPWENLLSRIAWMSRVLGTPTLSSVHEAALHEISRSYGELLQGGNRNQLEQFVRETFAILRKTKFANPLPVLDLITTIGTEVMRSRDDEWIEAIIDEVLDLDFQYPSFSGYTEEWQVRVNPGHLKNIRTYLALINQSPMATRPLLAALIVHLKIGGIFVADTDLFQRDITQLLNSDIRDSYDLVKHACKVFPVYFSDIGAEGELRDTSTRLDELRQRKDRLCHFLRKQCHVESNSRLVSFVDNIVRYLATGATEPLEPYLPKAVYEELDVGNLLHADLHHIFSTLSQRLGSPEAVLQLPSAKAAELIDSFSKVVDSEDLEKAKIILRVRELIRAKYEIDHHDIVTRLREFHHIDGHHVGALERALERGRPREALALLLEILERLQRIVLNKERTEGMENIYHKRHVAVGIPSMYGRYREEKFEAMGLTFRVEALADVLFERMISQQNLHYITKSTLQRVAVWMRMLLRALRIEGFRARSLELRIWMLEQALQSRGFTVDQYINVFQMIKNSIRHLIRARFLDIYEPILERLVDRMRRSGVIAPPRDEENLQAFTLRYGEAFLRDMISQSFGLQRLDDLVGRIIHTLSQQREHLDVDTLNLLMTYDVDRCFVEIERESTPQSGHIYVGNKGFMLRRLVHYGFPVPQGFILTTEVFRCRKAIEAFPELKRAHVDRIETQIRRLEQLTGRRYGNPNNALLLSVRSGAAMSMPGMLDSFLNVGMNDEITAGFAAQHNCPWGAWDAYRRYLQFWGMSFGVNRDQFDQLMQEVKEAKGVEKKSQLVPDDMRALAGRYRTLVLDHKIAIEDDPWRQLRACIDLVLDSWDSNKARVYRKALQIAEEWGTAVIVQRMVYGNLNDHSGTGVVFTRHPWQASEDVHLYGDFVIQGQGDDVVSGLVDTYPITEHQRLNERNTDLSLEKDFPEIYGALSHHCHALISEVGMLPQELEFTFDNDTASGLHVLQSRDIILAESTTISAFVPSQKLDRAKVAIGIGVGGGAICGRVAHCHADIPELRRDYPLDKVILLRPDTVPDDIHMLLESDGLLTAIGGATSHAAVASQRLGKVCVVGCRSLEVDERNGQSRLVDHLVKTGDFISINGQDGSVYLGEHGITTVRT